MNACLYVCMYVCMFVCMLNVYILSPIPPHMSHSAANLIYFERMDNVELVRVAESQEKAMNSAKKNITLRTMDLLSEGVPGAMPVMWQGYCLGAIGISGHDPETDRMIATAGLGVINDI